MVARLRKDAALCDLPPALPPGQKRGRGRPPIYGKDRLSLAKRAGQTRGWKEVTVKATTGRAVTRRYKTFLATWRPAGGVVRVVILKEDDGSWRAFLCTDAGAGVEAIVQAIQDRWAIEQNYHDLKEVERIEQVQLRRVWSNVGAFNLSLWVHTLVEVWAWGRPEAIVERPERSPVGRCGPAAVPCGQTPCDPAGDAGGGISAARGPGAVVGENPPTAGRRGQAGRMTAVSSGKVQCRSSLIDLCGDREHPALDLRPELPPAFRRMQGGGMVKSCVWGFFRRRASP